MKKETYVVANEEEYCKATKQAMADCAKVLHYLCDKQGVKIDDAAIYYDREEYDYIPAAVITASIRIDDPETVDTLLAYYKIVYNRKAYQQGIINVNGYDDVTKATIYIFNKKKAIEVECQSKPIIVNTSEEE